VSDLKDAVSTKLMLHTGPDLFRLRMEGVPVDLVGRPVYLDSCKKLADQGVVAGSKVTMQVIKCW